MEKILVLTDPHLRAPGETIIGLDPRTRLETALTEALRDHPDVSATVIMGDLTHSGQATEYAVLRDVLAHLTVPVHLMLGNHDHRGRFSDAFPETPRTPTGHIQQVIDRPGHRLILLDTYDAEADPAHSGVLCSDRLAWLEDQLTTAGPRHVVVFTHHPPLHTGIVGMDLICLTNGDVLLDRLAPVGAHLVCGHLHRTVSGQARGVSYSMFKSTCHQGVLDLHDPDCSLSVAEPGAYGLLLLSPDGIVAHSQDVGLGLMGAADQDALPQG